MSSDTTTNSPNFISLDEAAAMTEGTRITFIPGVQALFAEALKNICFVKGIPVIRALHPLMGVDKETGQDRQAGLYELTSQTGLPTMSLVLPSIHYNPTHNETTMHSPHQLHLLL